MTPVARTDATNELLTLEDLAVLGKQRSRPAETLLDVVGLVAQKFKTDVCSVYLLEPDRANLVLAATVGLRQSCIGTLRLALHEGLDWLGGGAGAPARRRGRIVASALQVLPARAGKTRCNPSSACR